MHVSGRASKVDFRGASTHTYIYILQMTEDHGQFISVLRLLKNVWERFGSQASFLQEIDASLGVILFRTTDWDLLRLHQDCVMHSVGLWRELLVHTFPGRSLHETGDVSWDSLDFPRVLVWGPSQVQPWIFAPDHGLQRSSAAASEPPGRKSGAARVALHGLGPSPSSPLKWWLNQSKSPFSQ